MLRISNLTDYATIVLATMARTPEAVHTTTDLSASAHLGRPTVSKLLKQFAQAGLLTSYRGAHGGYRLARASREISVATIIDLVEGPMAVTECGRAGHECELEAVCGVGNHWQRINRAIRDALEEVSLADLARSEAVEVPRIDLRQAVIGEGLPS